MVHNVSFIVGCWILFSGLLTFFPWDFSKTTDILICPVKYPIAIIIEQISIPHLEYGDSVSFITFLVKSWRWFGQSETFLVSSQFVDFLQPYPNLSGLSDIQKTGHHWNVICQCVRRWNQQYFKSKNPKSSLENSLLSEKFTQRIITGHKYLRW